MNGKECIKNDNKVLPKFLSATLARKLASWSSKTETPSRSRSNNP